MVNLQKLQIIPTNQREQDDSIEKWVKNTNDHLIKEEI